jgi:hypothetical protein
MSNRSYLCATNLETTYPSFVDKEYDPAKQTIACDVWCVPLLWTALFRAADIVRRTFTVDGDDVFTEAPLVMRTKAIRQLQEAIPYFARLFASEGSVDEYAAFLRQALESVTHQYVTIELEEIACLTNPEQAFYDSFRTALAAIGTDYSAAAKARFCEIAAFRDLKRLPPARLLLEEPEDFEATDDDFWNHCRVCGAGESEAGIGRPVPWEPQ